MARKLTFEKIVRPVITEKTLKLVDELNQYTFLVDRRVTKKDVASAVAEKFNVTVEKVRIVNNPGKRVSWGAKRISGRKKAIKKAFVTLKTGDSIDLFKVQ